MNDVWLISFTVIDFVVTTDYSIASICIMNYPTEKN